MKLKLGIMSAVLLVASCGSDQPQIESVRYVEVDKNSEDATALEDKAVCVSSTECAPVDFDLTILHNGDVDAGNTNIKLDGKTLVAQEGINSQWHFRVDSSIKLPEDREFRFVLNGDLGIGIDLEEKVFNNFVFNVESGEKAGNIGVKVQDVTFCMMNNDGDRDYCLNEATDEELRTQLVMVPFMVAKKEHMVKAMACTAGNIAQLIPGDASLIASIAMVLLGCQ